MTIHISKNFERISLFEEFFIMQIFSFYWFVQANVPEKILSEADEAETIASVRLAYQDLSVKAKKEEEKLKNIDPQKAKQMERLGMGFARRG